MLTVRNLRVEHFESYFFFRERSGSVVECLTQDRGAAGSSLTGVTALWSLSKSHYPSLVLVQLRKTRSCLTERLLVGRRELNQTIQAFHTVSIVLYIRCSGQVVEDLNKINKLQPTTRSLGQNTRYTELCV